MTETDFDKWLFGQEGYGLRIERLHEDTKEVPFATLLPWLQAAFDVGVSSGKLAND